MTNDPVSEAIEKKLTTFAEDHQGKFCLNLEIIDGYTGMDMTLEFFREALHHIATLSYTRGVEDSAKLVDEHAGYLETIGGTKMREIAQLIAEISPAIRSLIPNEKKV